MAELTVPQILDLAAEVIEQRGWLRGNYAPDDPATDLDTCPVCVLGAINVAAGRLPNSTFYLNEDSGRRAAAEMFAEYLGLDDGLGRDAVNLVVVVGDEWNDKVAEDKQEVIDELRAAAADLRAGGGS